MHLGLCTSRRTFRRCEYVVFKLHMHLCFYNKQCLWPYHSIFLPMHVCLFQVQKQILEDLVHAKIIGFFTEWCNTDKKEQIGMGYLDVTVLYLDDNDVKPGEHHWIFTEDRHVVVLYCVFSTLYVCYCFERVYGKIIVLFCHPVIGAQRLDEYLQR